MDSRFSLMKSISILFAAVLTTASVGGFAAIPRYSTNPNDFVRSGLQHFWVDGKPFRFVGYNVRGLTHYGGGYFLGDSQTSDRETNLAYMESVGAKVVRVFAACRFANNVTLGNGLDAVLQVASQHNIRVIVAFTDEYYSNFCPAGDQIYYGYQGNGILNQNFFNGGYLNYYWPFVQYIVNRFKNDPTVFAWQLGNELKCPWNPSDILPFCSDMAARIRAIDTNHMVSYGTAGRNFSGLTTAQATQLYQDFDFLTVHAYNGDDSNNDSSLANTLRKPLLISEAGFDTDNPNRPAATNADISKWVNRGARGYMNWGLMIANNGDGDDIFGIDPFNHAYDFNDYTNVYTTWANTLAITLYPTPDPPTGVNASDGTWGDRVEITWNEAFSAIDYAVFRSYTSSGPLTQVSPWQAARRFFDTSVVRGVTYYYRVQTHSLGGYSNYSSYNTGYASAAPEKSISQAKQLANGEAAYVTGGIVTAAYSGEFYIEQPDRASGISVSWSGAVNEGDRVNVLGTISMSASGERKLTATSVLVLP